MSYTLYVEKSYPHLCVSSEHIKHPSRTRPPWLTEEGTPATTDIAILGEMDTVTSQPGCCVSAAFIPELPDCNARRASWPALTQE